MQRIAAIEEQQTASEQPQEEQPLEQAAVAQQPEQDLSAEYELDDLDEAQEELLKWMLYVHPDDKEEDLDEMVDYDEFGDEEYEDIFEEVEEILEEQDYDLKVGDKVVGTVYEVDEDGAYVEIGAKVAGFVPLAECSLAKLKTPLEVLRPGIRREFVVVEEEDDYGEIILSLAALESSVFWQRTRQLQEMDITVPVTVLAANRGGLLVQYNHLQGFVPVSQFGPAITPESMESLIGLEIPAKLMEVDEERERLVFSNRRAGSDAEIINFKPGDVVVGVVQSVKPYGAFIDIGGATGLLHISQISHERVSSVEQVLTEGDKLKVMVLSQDRERGRVTLSTKKLEPTPGDMIRDPQLVYEKAEEMAATFRERVEQARQAGFVEQEALSFDELQQIEPVLEDTSAYAAAGVDAGAEDIAQ